MPTPEQLRGHAEIARKSGVHYLATHLEEAADKIESLMSALQRTLSSLRSHDPSLAEYLENSFKE